MTDIHCHIEGEEYPDKAAVIESAENSGVNILINSGSDILSSKNSLILAENYKGVYFSAGVHPDAAKEITEENLEVLRRIASHSKCVAIGEIGLDYHYGDKDKEIQKAAFIAQIELANELSLPVVVHSRDAHEDTLNILTAHPVKAGGAMHCFSGSKELAKRYVDAGFYISFGGTLTFKNAVKTVEVLKSIPLFAVLTETDSPYLSPEPKRGKKNYPENVRLVCEKMAALLNKSVKEIDEITVKNAKTLFYKLK